MNNGFSPDLNPAIQAAPKKEGARVLVVARAGRFRAHGVMLGRDLTTGGLVCLRLPEGHAAAALPFPVQVDPRKKNGAPAQRRAA